MIRNGGNGLDRGGVTAMSAAELHLTYVPDDQWLGELTAVVRSGAFSGQGSAWFDQSTVRDAFVTSLRSFPLSSTAPPTIEGGTGSNEDFQCHLRLTIKPYNNRGILLVQADLVSDYRQAAVSDAPNSATIRFLTEYALVNTFAGDLDQVLDGRRDVAVLTGISS
jgi:hypothetical protein